ncbi:MAG TPA: YihY/virulence factor BrkB family protein [Armatimonadota bacterium]|nr:YihY/virulence factor BrkB family protein [Armatimonadota bacterium]
MAQAIAGFAAPALAVMREVWRDSSRKGVSMIAAALAFYLFLALFPFLLVLIAVAGYVLPSSEQGLALVREALDRALPGSSTMGIQRQIESVIAHRAIVGGLGLLGILWSASGAFAVLARALRIIWESGSKSLLRTRVRALVLVLVAVLLMLASLALSSALSIIARLNAAGVLALLGELGPLWRLVSATLPLSVGFVTFLAVYRIVPAPQLKLRHVGVGAAFAAVAWEIARWGFSWYLAHFANFDRVYGPVGAVVVLMLWIYVSSVVALVGAELAWVCARRWPG